MIISHIKKDDNNHWEFQSTKNIKQELQNLRPNNYITLGVYEIVGAIIMDI